MIAAFWLPDQQGRPILRIPPAQSAEKTAPQFRDEEPAYC